MSSSGTGSPRTSTRGASGLVGSLPRARPGRSCGARCTHPRRQSDSYPGDRVPTSPPRPRPARGCPRCSRRTSPRITTPRWPRRPARSGCGKRPGWARELVGGNGILLENHVGRFVADSEAIYSYEGTREINTLIVGRAITGLGAFPLSGSGMEELTDRARAARGLPSVPVWEESRVTPARAVSRGFRRRRPGRSVRCPRCRGTARPCRRGCASNGAWSSTPRGRWRSTGRSTAPAGGRRPPRWRRRAG